MPRKTKDGEGKDCPAARFGFKF